MQQGVRWKNEKVDLSKYTETNTCNLDVSINVRTWLYTPQQNSEVLQEQDH